MIEANDNELLLNESMSQGITLISIIQCPHPMSTDNHATKAATADITFYKPKISYQEAWAKSTIPFFLCTSVVLVNHNYYQTAL